MIFVLWSFLISQKPVIELDDLIVEGEIRRPRVIQLQGSRLPEALEKAALFNLIELEKRLLEPRSPEAFSDSKKSAN